MKYSNRPLTKAEALELTTALVDLLEQVTLGTRFVPAQWAQRREQLKSIITREPVEQPPAPIVPREPESWDEVRERREAAQRGSIR
jgi:hypothetical protein